MVAAKKLYPDARIVFAGSQERTMREFFLESAAYAIDFDRLKSIDVERITRLIIVDNRNLQRLGKLAKAVGRAGVQVHVEDASYVHDAFRPWRLQALAFKAIRRLHPDYPLWRDFPYEYEFGKLAIDVINGGPALREWVDDAASTAADLDALTLATRKFNTSFPNNGIQTLFKF